MVSTRPFEYIGSNPFLDISEKEKQELIIYHYLDWLKACQNISNEIDLAEKVYSMMKEIRMEIHLDKIQNLLENEKNAIWEGKGQDVLQLEKIFCLIAEGSSILKSTSKPIGLKIRRSIRFEECVGNEEEGENDGEFDENVPDKKFTAISIEETNDDQNNDTIIARQKILEYLPKAITSIDDLSKNLPTNDTPKSTADWIKLFREYDVRVLFNAEPYRKNDSSIDVSQSSETEIQEAEAIEEHLPTSNLIQGSSRSFEEVEAIELTLYKIIMFRLYRNCRIILRNYQLTTSFNQFKMMSDLKPAYTVESLNEKVTRYLYFQKSGKLTVRIYLHTGFRYWGCQDYNTDIEVEEVRQGVPHIHRFLKIVSEELPVDREMAEYLKKNLDELLSQGQFRVT
ncbi:unnamed protein product [Caenorhabditis angaria]|uniref:Uncharacterized protein n=1 Tax=Caenorhabditis angaria TaxID=860376 RepID=A0A9P1I3W0_9PELO|nr:unnamed protein product [Caenorhabditis angaria]